MCVCVCSHTLHAPPTTLIWYMCGSALQRAAVCCSVWVCCSELQLLVSAYSRNTVKPAQIFQCGAVRFLLSERAQYLHKRAL
mmetsp:Transcript_3436/g.5536  ORF Transcript_3436/g.5536 Transcript_3436/m.5536 type:complete len:82 (+) Transcript_3436:188-433(+)